MKKKIVTYALGTIVVIICTIGYFGGKHALAEPAGAKCTSSTSCRGNSVFSTGMCLEDGEASYCTHECSANSDCTSGLACAPVDGTWTTETTRGNHASQTRTTTGVKNLCVKPE